MQARQGAASKKTRRAGWYFRTRAQRASLYFREALLIENQGCAIARLQRRLAALAFLSTTPLASCLGSPPLLFQEGNFLVADTSSLGLLGQALKPWAGGLSPLRGYCDITWLQRECEDFINRSHRMELHRVPHVRRQILEITFVALRQNDLRQSRGLRRHDLLLHSADRKHASLQRNLAGHPNRALHRSSGQQGSQRRDHRDPRARSILRNGARGNVHVKLTSFERVFRNSQVRRMALHVAERNPRRLLHHVTELARQHEPASSR